MAVLDFPASPVDGQQYTAENGVVYTFIANPIPGYWSALNSNEDALADTYLKLDASNGPVIGALGIDSLLTAAGGVQVTDGSVTVTKGSVLSNTASSIAVQGFLNQDTGAKSNFTAFKAAKSSSIVNVDEVIGYEAGSNLTGGVNNSYGFKSNIAVNGNKNYNFYAAGSAPNYFASHVKVGNGDAVIIESSGS